jgi:CRP-like cAMP-binding protein
VARFRAGDFFGEISALEGTRRSARAVAIGPACVLRLDRATLEAMCVSEPEIALRLMRGLARRLLDAEHRLARVDADELLRPLVRAMLGAAQPDPRHGSRIPLTLREIAEASGLTLLEAHLALQLLFEQGVLQLLDDCLVAPDLARLSPRSEPPPFAATR